MVVRRNSPTSVAALMTPAWYGMRAMDGALPALWRSLSARTSRWPSVRMLREDRVLLGLTLLLSVVSLAPMFLTPILPLVDLGSHVGAAGLLDELVRGAPVVSERYAINASWLPYWVGYFLMGALDAIGGPFFAAKATVAIVVLLVPVATMRLLVALGRSPRLGLWAFLLCWDVNLYWGWFTFQLGMGLALWAIAWIIEASSWREGARVVPLAAVVALTHLHAVALLGVAGALLALLKPRPLKMLAVHAIALSGLLALLPWVLPRLLRGGTPGAWTFQQSSLADKILQLYQYSLNTMPAAVTFTLWTFMLLLVGPLALAALDPKPPAPRSSALALGILASCMLLYFVLPFQVFGAVSHFWTFPRYGTYILLALLLLPSVGLEGRRALLLAPGIALVFAVGWDRAQQFSQYGERVRPYLDIVAAMKPGSKFLPLDYEFHWPGAHQPTLGQLHGYAAAARSSYDPHLFDHDSSPIVYRPEGRPPEPDWFHPFESFSMERHGQYYDYIIVHPKSRDTQLTPETAELVREAGEWRLYAVKRRQSAATP